MIKNILYSLFLHFLLLLLVYANFNLKNINEDKASEISVSLIAISGSQEFDQSKISKDTTTLKKPDSVKKESTKTAKSEKESQKNKVASLPQKKSKSKPTKSVSKPADTKNASPVKEVEKPEPKPQEIRQNKPDDVNKENPEDKKITEPKKDQDIGAEKPEPTRQDSDNKKDSGTETAAAQINNLENIDLSVREKFNIQSQLQRCYYRAVSESGFHIKDSILIPVSINEEGVINSDIDDAIDLERYNNAKDPNYKIMIDNARRALELCSPIRNLPLDKYEIWKNVILEFGDK